MAGWTIPKRLPASNPSLNIEDMIMDEIVKDNFEELRACLLIAFKAFSHDDDGPVWSDTLIARTEKVLKATENLSPNI